MRKIKTLSSETVIISEHDMNVVTVIAENDSEITAERIYGSEFDITLEDIRKKYEPYSIITVICETPLRGDIYQYGNYLDEAWYCIGETIGYA